MNSPRKVLRCAIALVAVLTTLTGCDAWLSPKQRIERAEQSIAKGDYRSASIDLRTALQEEGSHVTARLLMARVAMKLGDPLAAETEIRKARELGASTQSTAQLEADVLLALGKFAELIKAFETQSIALSEPDRSIALGRARNGLGQYSEAVSDFSRALHEAPASKEASAGLAEALGARGELQEGLTLTAKLTREVPSFAYGWLVQGGLQARDGQFDAAATSLKHAEHYAADQLDVRRVTTLLGLAVEVGLVRGDYATANRAQQKLAASGFNPVLAALLRGRVLMAERKYVEAIDVLQPLVAGAGDLATARFLLGAALLADSRLEQAEHHLSQLVREHPEHIDGRKLLAQVRLRLSRGGAAMEALMPALEADDADASISTLAAAASLQSGDRDKAFDILEKAVAQRPNTPEPYLQLARVLIADKKFERAMLVLQGMPADLHAHPQRAALLIGAVAAKEGLPAADRTVEALVSESKENTAVMNVAAAYYARRGELERAKTYLLQVLKRSPTDIDTELHLARLFEASGDLNRAQSLVDTATAQDPRNVSATLEAARFAAQRKDFTGAVRILEQALARTPRDGRLQLSLIRQYHLAGQAAKADELARSVLAASAQSAELNFALGQICSDVGAYDQALARYLAASAAAPNNVGYRFAVARTRLALGQTEAARSAFNEILQRQPDWTPAVAAVALMDMRAGHAAAALDRIKAHIEKSPNDPTALVLLGDVQMALREYSTAADTFSRAAKHGDSAVTAVKEARARQLAALDNVEAPLLRWLQRQPGDLMVHRVLAEMYSTTGRNARAMAEYELIVAQQPRDAAALNNLAWLYFESGDARALGLAARAYKLAPEVAAIADTYGWILTQQDQAAAAVGILQKADVAASGQFEIGYHHAVALAKSGQTNAARQRLTALLKAPPGSAPQREVAEQLLSRLNAH